MPKLSSIVGVRCRWHPLWSFVIGVVLTALACGVLVALTRSFAAQRLTSISIAAELPALRSSVSLLRAVTDAERAFTETGMASREELASAYVLPLQSPSSRFAASVSSIVATLSSAGVPLHLERLVVAEEPEDRGSVRAYAASLTVTGDDDALARFLALLERGASMMVRDVVDEETQEQIRRMVEARSPTALASFERFLYTDLLAYAAEPDARELRLLEELSPGARDDVRALLLQGGLSSVRRSFEGIASVLHADAVWPLPLTEVVGYQRSGSRAQIELRVYGR